jgi:hypothetical protein
MFFGLEVFAFQKQEYFDLALVVFRSKSIRLPETGLDFDLAVSA